MRPYFNSDSNEPFPASTQMFQGGQDELWGSMNTQNKFFYTAENRNPIVGDVFPFNSASGSNAPHLMPSINDFGYALSTPAPRDTLFIAFCNLADLSTKMLFTHPCVALRRQCQVHQFAKSLHVTPFTLVHVVCNMVASEGLQSLWKGAVGSNVLWILSTASEVLISDVFRLPRSLVKYGSRKKFFKHIALKACTFFTMTPFIVSSFIETVRSETGLIMDDVRVMDVITNGIRRLHYDFFGARDNSKRFTLFFLAVPTTIHHTIHYLIFISIYDRIYNMAERYVSRKSAPEKTVFHAYLPHLFATMTAKLAADFILYPMETILHRLYIQGTRTLIDNLDSGLSATSITAKYTGFFDCLKSIFHHEGLIALYSGLGAMTLQYVLHFLFLRLVRSVFSCATTAFMTKRHGISGNACEQLRSASNACEQLRSASNARTSSNGDHVEKVVNQKNFNPHLPSPYPSFGQTSSAAFSGVSPPRITSPPSAGFFAENPSLQYFSPVDKDFAGHDMRNRFVRPPD